MSRASTSSTSSRNAAPETDIGPDNALFWDVLQAFGDWYDNIGGTDLDLDSPVQQLDQLAAHFERHVRESIPQLAHLVRGDPTVYYGVMVHFLGQQEFADESGDEDGDDNDE